jgi:hypothetical protein
VIAPAATTAAKTTKSEAATVRGNASTGQSEAFGNPYETPLLLNAKPLMIGRP